MDFLVNATKKGELLLKNMYCPSSQTITKCNTNLEVAKSCLQNSSLGEPIFPILGAQQ